jgi:protein arginine N-methyltransferase 1
MLARSVQPCVPIDCEGFGRRPELFSLLACQFGARHVYAVEPDKAIEVAKAAATNNGYADRISFHQGFSTELSLPEGVDILISDLRGVIPRPRH